MRENIKEQMITYTKALRLERELNDAWQTCFYIPINEWEPYVLAKEKNDFSEVDKYLDKYFSGEDMSKDGENYDEKLPLEGDVLLYLLDAHELQRAKQMIDHADPTCVTYQNKEYKAVFAKMMELFEDEEYLVHTVERLHEMCTNTWSDELAMDCGNNLLWAVGAAYEAKKYKLTKTLLRFTIEFSTEEDDAILYSAIRKNDIEMVEMYLQEVKEHGSISLCGESEKWTPLECAVVCEGSEIVDLLLQYGANPNTLSYDDSGRTMLEITTNDKVRHVLCAHGGVPTEPFVKLLYRACNEYRTKGSLNEDLLYEILSQEHNEELRYVWSAAVGASLRGGGCDLLQMIGRYEDINSLRIIVEYFAEYTVTRPTAQWLERIFDLDAIPNPLNRLNSNLFVCRVIDLFSEFEIRFSARDYASQDKNDGVYWSGSFAKYITKSLLETIKEKNQLGYHMYAKHIYKKMIYLAWNLFFDEDKKAFLAYSLERGNHWMVRILREYDLDYSMLDLDDTSALWYITRIAEFEKWKTSEYKWAIEVAVENGADVNHQMKNGDTVLHALAKSRYTHRVYLACRKLLVEYGVNPLTKNAEGLCADEIRARRHK